MERLRWRADLGNALHMVPPWGICGAKGPCQEKGVAVPKGRLVGAKDPRWRKFRNWLRTYEATIKRFDKTADWDYYRGMLDAIEAISDTAKEMNRDLTEDGDNE